ncbi:type III-B CRISPR-associated protein Cas10/Cmr2 [Thermoflexus sp.]|uniref:type III-B CRISPR-associated protein Cas10/Cmr2 n=1 Tax=Thermoflexus sp. TaxID=1969742 RepID=UPI002ADD7E8E|nr:type III-B CRISPR-associated protein Cas10/Cmr2 [Thermoflexus sp.]
MSESVLIFTFSPIQSFIAEARRTSDLYVGSKILVSLAKAAAQAIQLQHLIYPAPMNGQLPDDVPNVIVARVKGEAEQVAQKAKDDLLWEWQRLADQAKSTISQYCPIDDDTTWQQIWYRQIHRHWQVFWAAASIEGEDYAEAYRAAREALDAVKRSRVFEASEESGPKDSLSGARQALHTRDKSPKEYWEEIARQVGGSKLRPGGRERLDAIGAIKRFCELANWPFPSTSTVASADFLERARQRAPDVLGDYGKAIRRVLGKNCYEPYGKDPNWPFDGDLLFEETLTLNRLTDSYHGIEGTSSPDEAIQELRRSLYQLYEAVEGRPSPYYAIFVLDGDGMGERISTLLTQCDPEGAHRRFSQQLSEFARRVPDVMRRVFSERIAYRDSTPREGSDFLVYNGGDDVLGFAPLSIALLLVQELAREFEQVVPGCSASAGVAIAHHLYPLDAALAAAREAERAAKSVADKAAVAVMVLRRSGERLLVRSRWESLHDRFDALVAHFAKDRLSSRFAYELADRATVATDLPKDARRSLLRQLIGRHKGRDLSDQEEEALVQQLAGWAEELDLQLSRGEGEPMRSGLLEVARWVLLARFIASGGGA